MNETDRWISLEGPPPEPIGLLLAELSNLSPMPPGPAGYDGRSPAGAEALAPSDGGGPATARVPMLGDPSAAPPPSPPPPSHRAAAGDLPRPAPPEFVSTAPLDLSSAVAAALGKLPFGAPRPAVPGKAPQKTIPSPVMPVPGETTPDDAISKAVALVLPFVRASGGAAPHASAEPPKPSEGREAASPSGPPSFANFGVHHYASLCAELVVSPAKSAEILARYHLSGEAERRALDEEWKRRFAAQPDLGAQFQVGLARFIPYARAQLRSG